MISIHDKPTIGRLRCVVGAYLPSKTAHQTMSLTRIFMRVKVMLTHFKERYFTIDRSLPPILNNQNELANAKLQ